MKKIITITFALVLILSMSIPAAAVTPDLDTPTISIPDISGSIHVEIPDGYWDSYFEDHPIDITPIEEPTEPRPLPNLSISRPSWWEWLTGLHKRQVWNLE